MTSDKCCDVIISVNPDFGGFAWLSQMPEKTRIPERVFFMTGCFKNDQRAKAEWENGYQTLSVCVSKSQVLRGQGNWTTSAAVLWLIKAPVSALVDILETDIEKRVNYYGPKILGK